MAPQAGARAPLFKRPLRLAAAGLGLLALAAHAKANDGTIDTIAVNLDQAKLLKLPAGAETIIVGNPAVADVTVHRNGVLVVTGRMPGRTNFIALDGSGTIISESILQVSGQGAGLLVVQRGIEQTTYSCAPKCLPTVHLGDEDKHFARGIDQTTKRDALANQNPNGTNRK